MSNSLRLTSSSTLKDLPLYNFRVSPKATGHAIADKFEQEVNLPGVIVVDDSQILGVISRRRFHERMSKGYGQEIFFRRPIRIFLELNEGRTSILQLAHTERVAIAMQKALSRPPEDLYEPIVITMGDPNMQSSQSYFLLDFHTLLLAQSQILVAVNHEIHHQATHLAEERQKSQEYARLLETQQGFIRERNQLLENQRTELIRQSQEIAQLNRRFVQIGQILSVEGKKAFQATFQGVNAICQNTSQIVACGQLLSEELDIVHATSKLIEKVSRQVKHLAVQAAIVANRSGADMPGLGHITDEIGKLGNQILEAGGQMDLIANRFKSRTLELMQSANSGTLAARALIEKIRRAESALADLEELVQFELPAIASLPAESSDQLSGLVPDNIQTLMQKMALVEDTLSEVKNLIQRKDSKPLLYQLRQVLNRPKSNNLPAENSSVALSERLNSWENQDTATSVARHC
jgi:hypothetical protein